MAQEVHQQPEQTARDRGWTRHDPHRPGVEVAYAAERATVRVVGRVDRAKTIEVSGTVRGLVAGGVPELVVDLSESWDGARLLPALARTRAVLAERGGTPQLIGVALPEFLAALRTAPLDEVFLIYDAVRRSPAAGVHGLPGATAVTAEQRVADGTIDQVGA